jgi:transmembrane sensor
MPIPSERLDFLLRQYAAGSCTRKELLELFETIRDAQQDAALNDSLQTLWQEIGANERLPMLDKEKIFQQIAGKTKIQPIPSGRIRTIPRQIPFRIGAAAAIFLAVLTGGIALWRGDHPRQTIVQRNISRVNDIAPGGDKAILTLADGSHIVLDSAGKGDLSRQGAMRVIKLDSARLVYREVEKTGAASASGSTATTYNIIQTPRGGQYQVVLADGTQVWLNAASSLKFPTRFDGKERMVELSGEAYFEVAHGTTAFKVHVLNATGDGGVVEVLGTHFNINAYTDEPMIKTTLLEGSVLVLKGQGKKLLKPGQQAQVFAGSAAGAGSAGSAGTADGGSSAIRLISDANTEEAVAWKNGYFQFEGADIQVVMRQLSRWYNMDVSYEGTIPERQFAGQMQRGLYLSEILRILEASNVHFRIEGKKVVVTP